MTPQEAAIELLTRRKARRNYLDYLGIASTEGKPAAHHKLMIERLQAVADADRRMALSLQMKGNEFGDIRFIFDDQDLAHGLVLRRCVT